MFVCHFRRFSILEETAAEISSQTGNPVVAVQMDIRDPSAVSTALDLCEAKFGLPNIVINNAAGNFISVSHICSPSLHYMNSLLVFPSEANSTEESIVKIPG